MYTDKKVERTRAIRRLADKGLNKSQTFPPARLHYHSKHRSGKPFLSFCLVSSMAQVYPVYKKYENVFDALKYVKEKLSNRLGASEPIFAAFALTKTPKWSPDPKRVLDFEKTVRVKRLLEIDERCGSMLWLVEEGSATKKSIPHLQSKTVVEARTRFAMFEDNFVSEQPSSWYVGRDKNGYLSDKSCKSHFFFKPDTKRAVVSPLRVTSDALLVYHHGGTSFLSWLFVPQNQVFRLLFGLRFYCDNIQRGIYAADAVLKNKSATKSDLSRSLLNATTRLIHQGCTHIVGCQNFFLNVDFLKTWEVGHEIYLQKPKHLLYIPPGVAHMCVTEGCVFLETSHFSTSKTSVMLPICCNKDPIPVPIHSVKSSCKRFPLKNAKKYKCFFCKIVFSRQMLFRKHDCRRLASY